MRVLLVSNYLPDEQQSMLRYARMLERELIRNGIEATIFYPPAILTRLTGRKNALGKWVAYLDKYLLAPPCLRRKAASFDLVHICDHANSMYARCAGLKPVVITCHDLLAVLAAQGRFPGIKVSATGRWLQRWIARSLTQARFVLCISQKTSDDLRQLTALAPQIAVVPHALNWPYHPVSQAETEAALSQLGLDAQTEYLLHIGNNSWYKNRPGVVKIFTALKQDPRFGSTKLILCGKPWTSALAASVAGSGQADAIVDGGRVSNEHLRALYSGARLFLFPSYEEGFGWPILEAQACGCPVVIAARPPMSEVSGGAAILVDPDDPAGAAKHILNALPRLDELRAAGLANVSKYSMSRLLDGTTAFYRQAIAGNAPQSIGPPVS
jgi:glycosyltransferase involved in cell wall biosynthesis